MLYKSSVILFNENKYEEIVIQNVVNELYKYTSFDGNEWICRSCHIALSRNNVPIQTKANGLELDAIPNELKDLVLIRQFGVSGAIVLIVSCIDVARVLHFSAFIIIVSSPLY